MIELCERRDSGSSALTTDKIIFAGVIHGRYYFKLQRLHLIPDFDMARSYLEANLDRNIDQIVKKKGKMRVPHANELSQSNSSQAQQIHPKFSRTLFKPSSILRPSLCFTKVSECLACKAIVCESELPLVVSLSAGASEPTEVGGVEWWESEERNLERKVAIGRVGTVTAYGFGGNTLAARNWVAGAGGRRWLEYPGGGSPCAARDAGVGAGCHGVGPLG
jgi:hypothetical protein